MLRRVVCVFVCVCVCVRMCAPPAVQTSMMDSDYNLDPNCLSRCSTELLSEASWEQVDKQDTEVRRPLCLSRKDQAQLGRGHAALRAAL